MKKLTHLLIFLLFLPTALAYSFDDLLDDAYNFLDSMLHSYYVVYIAILLIVFLVVRLVVKRALEKINFNRANLAAAGVGIFAAFSVHYFMKITRLNTKIANLVKGNNYLAYILIAILIYVFVVRKIKNAVVLLAVGIGLIIINYLPFMHMESNFFTIIGIVFVLIGLIKYVFHHSHEHFPGI